MFSLSCSQQYYLYLGATDMRKSFDGLCGLVHNQMHSSVMSGQVYIFINRRRDKIKLLHWEPGGLVLYYKRLESGTFELPVYNDAENCCRIEWAKLVMMIDGISIKSIQKRKRFSN